VSTLTECFEFKYHSSEFMSLKSIFLDHVSSTVKIQIQNHYIQHFLCTVTSICTLKLNYKICNIMLSSLRTVKGVCFLNLQRWHFHLTSCLQNFSFLKHCHIAILTNRFERTIKNVCPHTLHKIHIFFLLG
jgi:hypothetical protein